MMFSEDYVQSMVTARQAAALVQDVELIRVVHERFAAVPARHWWQRIGDGRARGRRAGGAAAAVPEGVAVPAAVEQGDQGAREGAAAGRELAGTRR
ncbi:hypothetical protein P5G50_15695 [Leifsonia sp. F6_8S_P_1B]|uniref:Uncharacterized protein n=1 Tax=Leifsonia williamsii TaxID=3035919 RepID=A0ABT8KEP8_9MICO|nr:hypothetical protein [Leifsonia williamsii]MDN4615894.1 hypothetical protein [Leifsonia williamsii]